MDSTNLSRKLGQLVDLLRKDEEQAVSLKDIASITEALISVIRGYFNTLDTSVYRELHQLSGHISQAKTEIARLRPNEIKAQLPAAGDQLEAIVKGTELATHAIMEAIEEILAASAGESERAIEDACMRIFEACSFQDITDQRVTKVVKTLNYIEQRISVLLEAHGAEIEEIALAPEDQQTGGAGLLQGPALEGEGIDQSAVDALLGDDGTGDGFADNADARPVKGTTSPALSQDGDTLFD